MDFRKYQNLSEDNQLTAKLCISENLINNIKFIFKKYFNLSKLFLKFKYLKYFELVEYNKRFIFYFNYSNLKKSIFFTDCSTLHILIHR